MERTPAKQSIMVSRSSLDAFLSCFFEKVHFHVLPRRPGDFKRNDDVYVEIEKQTRALRSVEEMENEAKLIRRAVQDQKVIDKAVALLSAHFEKHGVDERFDFLFC
jgi:hypothetical protein